MVRRVGLLEKLVFFKTNTFFFWFNEFAEHNFPYIFPPRRLMINRSFVQTKLRVSISIDNRINIKYQKNINNNKNTYKK